MGMKDLGWSNAKWLKGNHQEWDRQDGATVLRKQFTMDSKKKVLKARLFAAAKGVFEVYMNGQRLGREDHDGEYVYDELKAGCVDYRTEVPYMTFDVTDLIKKGDNIMPRPVKVGMSDGAYRIIEQGVQAGDSVVLSAQYIVKEKAVKKGENPFMPGPPGRNRNNGNKGKAPSGPPQ